MTRQNRWTKWATLAIASMSTCFAHGCSAGFRDAALTGFYDFTSGTITTVLTDLVMGSS